MKKSVLIISLFVVSIVGYSQTATNFNCNDCSGTNHDLFTELNAGKVVVLCWVMPCSACISASKTTFNVVSSYQTNYPDRVKYYLVDDLGDTPCSSLNSWADANHIGADSSYSLRFSNSLISMSGYGSSGMPKIVVLGGSSHHVFYNANNSVNSSLLQVAIDSALLAPSTVKAISNELFDINIYPNPSNLQTALFFNLNKTSNVKVELYNIVGDKILNCYNGSLKTGESKININTSDLQKGIYFIKATVADKVKTIKLIIAD